MTSLIAFRRVVTPIYTHTLRLPDAPQGQQAAQELATLPDGRTVVALFDGFTLPANQPTEIVGSIEVLTLTDALKEQIKAASPQVALISTMMQQKIREVYSLEDEAFFSRIGVGVALAAYTFGPGEQAALLAFGAFVEGVRQWGRGERAKLGL
jgi:hypothetical protein